MLERELAAAHGLFDGGELTVFRRTCISARFASAGWREILGDRLENRPTQRQRREH
jgi:hypothetical protein